MRYLYVIRHQTLPLFMDESGRWNAEKCAHGVASREQALFVIGDHPGSCPEPWVLDTATGRVFADDDPLVSVELANEMEG